MSKQFREKARNIVNPYGSGGTVEKTVEIIRDYLLNKHIDLAKKFYDLD